MQKGKAISIINYQIEKIKTEDGKTIAWEIQTKAYIELFFGKESPQNEFFKRFNFASKYSYNPVSFLEECKMQIKNIGLYKKPKINLISSITNTTLFSIFFPLMVLIFTIGFYFGTEKINNELIKTERELNLLKESISTSKIIINTNSSKTKSDKLNTTTNN